MNAEIEYSHNSHNQEFKDLEEGLEPKIDFERPDPHVECSSNEPESCKRAKEDNNKHNVDTHIGLSEINNFVCLDKHED